MSAADVTPERFAELRLLEKHLCASGQMVGACLRESLAALESAWAERDAYLDEVQRTNENEARIMADLLATREERDKLRAELDRLRSAPVEVEVPTWSTDAFCTHVGLEGAFSAGDIRVFFAGAKACHGWISKEVHPIPSDRVLKEGERAVPVKELEVLRERIAWISCQLQVGYSAQIAASELADLLDAPSLDALRSSTNHDKKET